MIDSIKNTSLYKSLNLQNSNFHAYLLYSTDEVLNNEIAETFAMSFMCENHNSCGLCSKCKQFLSKSHPDFIRIQQPSIKVEDVNLITDKLSTKPISADHKIFLILNADAINEIAQNKLLKSLEEPTESAIFILTTSKPDKLLPTVMSRLKKIYVPTMSKEDKLLLSNDLLKQNVDISKYIDLNYSLTKIINFETSETHIQTLNAIAEMLKNLKTSADIPKVSSSLIKAVDKTVFLPTLQEVFLSAINNTKFIDKSTIEYVKSNYSKQALIKAISLVEDANKKLLANGNFSYILDNLLFDILKEKFLCK